MAAKKNKSTVSHKGMSHGKAIAKGTEMHMGPLGHKGKGKKGGKSMAKVEGHIDPNVMMHDAKGHEKGSRGPFTKASTGNSKSKN